MDSVANPKLCQGYLYADARCMPTECLVAREGRAPCKEAACQQNAWLLGSLAAREGRAPYKEKPSNCNVSVLGAHEQWSSTIPSPGLVWICCQTSLLRSSGSVATIAVQ